MTEEEYIAYQKVVRERNRLSLEAGRRAVAKSQAECRHVAGCNPRSESWDMYERTCIVWHTTLIGHDPVGICTNCLRVFRDTDPDYSQWRNRQSINRPSGVKAELPVTVADDGDKQIHTVLSEPMFRDAIYDDSSDNPADWTDDKLNKHIDVERQVYKLRKQLAS